MPKQVSTKLANYDDVLGREVSLFYPDQYSTQVGKGLWETVPQPVTAFETDRVVLLI